MEKHTEDLNSRLEESVWKLELDDKETRPPPPLPSFAYPERDPRRPCFYFLRNGDCGFGDSCRYYHPRGRRTYFARNTTCKFGDACKFEHPQGDRSVLLRTMNKYGYPLRPGEKDCIYYMKTGQCKFGLTCKFNHPELFGSPLRLFPSSSQFKFQPPSASRPWQYPATSSSEPPKPPMLPVTFTSGSYGPVLFFPGPIPDLYWSNSSGPVPPFISADGQEESSHGSMMMASFLFPGCTETYTYPGSSMFRPPYARRAPSPYGSGDELYPCSTTDSSAEPSIDDEAEHEDMLPERLDDPDFEDYATSAKQLK